MERNRERWGRGMDGAGRRRWKRGVDDAGRRRVERERKVEDRGGSC